MKHLYEINEDSELYAADSEAEARALFENMTGEAPEYVKQRDDDECEPLCLHCGRGGRTFAEIAATWATPGQVFTSYIDQSSAWTE